MVVVVVEMLGTVQCRRAVRPSLLSVTGGAAAEALLGLSEEEVAGGVSIVASIVPTYSA